MKLLAKSRLLAPLMTCLLASWGAATAHAQEITLKAISAWPSDNYFSLNFEKFVAKVNAEGKGLVQINNLGGGAKVMPPFEVANAVKSGVADIANVAGGFYTTVLPESDALSLGNVTAQELRKNGGQDYINKLWNERLNVQYLGRSVDALPIHIFLRVRARNATNAVAHSSMLVKHDDGDLREIAATRSRGVVSDLHLGSLALGGRRQRGEPVQV